MKFYLASPLWSDVEKERISRVSTYLREKGYEVYSPIENTIENAWDMPNYEWGAAIFKEDKGAIDNADTVVVIYDGLISDSGTAWEVGYAFGTGKKVIVLNCGEDSSLMVANGSFAFIKFEDFFNGYNFETTIVEDIEQF